MYFVYIIKSCVDGSFYTGISPNIKKRFQEHNQGLSQYTKSRTPWKLVWLCIFPSKEKAVKLEKYLKTASGIAFRNKRLVR